MKLFREFSLGAVLGALVLALVGLVALHVGESIIASIALKLAAIFVPVALVVGSVLLVIGTLLETAFIYCFTIRKLRESGVWMPRGAYVWAQVLYYPGALADVLYNASYGFYWFRELNFNGGIMFSNRVQWHIDNSTGDQLRAAIKWAGLLNAVAPNHIKRVPTLP